MSWKLALSVSVCAALCATAAAAQPAVTWVEAPTVAEVAAAYPDRARAEGIAGGVELSCTATRTGGLDTCVVLGEAPKGYGFGSAARRLAERELRAAGADNGDEVRVPVTFPVEVLSEAGLTVRTPKWAALPSVAEMQAVTPMTEGGPNDIRVTLVCSVQEGGSLSGCAVDREEPAGHGFGAAILKLAPKFRVEPWSAEGMPTVGAKVRVPVRFDLKPVEQAAR